MLKRMAMITLLLSFALPLLAGELKPVKLPPPAQDDGKALMKALKERRSTRHFSTRKLPDGVLSNLLWAACGVNRPDSGKRTAPSAKNWQEIDVYVTTAEGAYLYDAHAHSLVPVANRDLRKLTGMQPFTETAPVNLVYVADQKKMGGAGPEEKSMYSAADTGFIAQNVYLFCSSEGLATVVRGSVQRDALSKALNLRDDQKIVLAQTVGYPKE